MQDEDFGFDIISVTDDDGNEHQFEEIDRIETEDGNRYVALLPVVDSAEEILEGDGDVFILRVTEEKNGDTFLIQIEDEEEFTEIREIFEERISKMYDEEYFDGDGEE